MSDDERLLAEAEQSLAVLIRAASQYGRESMKDRGSNCFCVNQTYRGDLHWPSCRELTEALRRARAAHRALRRERVHTERMRHVGVQ